MNKRVFDLLLCIIFLAFFWPLYLIVALAVYIESGSPVLFYQQRIGKNGRFFRVIKFRSMVANAENEGTGLYSYSSDPRITRVGRIIRKTSLDELPQIFNVFRGNMSFVGPRPPVTYELGDWNDYSTDMLRRFEVNPGITGLAQVSGRNENDWDHKVKLDNIYVDLFNEWGIWIDLKILLITVAVVFSGKSTVEPLPSGIEGPISRRAREAAENYINHRKSP